MLTVKDFIRDRQNKPLRDIANKLIEKCDKNFPLKFYSRERLFSAHARRNFIEPDLINLYKNTDLFLFSSPRFALA